MEKRTIKVVCAVIHKEDKFLCTQRLRTGPTYIAEHWEFPGGKVAPNETPEQALKRELEEEVGILVSHATLFERFTFEYPTKILNFYFYLVDEWLGEPFGREGQEGFWLEQEELDMEQFPPANTKLIQRLLAEYKNSASHG